MSLLDWGVIALKDGKVLPETKNKDIAYSAIADGIGGKLQLIRANVYFYGDGVRENNSKNVIIDFASQINFKNKKACYWQYAGINFKTKEITDYMYLTKFKLNNSFYAVISGYDVSLSRWFEKSSERAIKKALRANEVKVPNDN